MPTDNRVKIDIELITKPPNVESFDRATASLKRYADTIEKTSRFMLALQLKDTLLSIELRDLKQRMASDTASMNEARRYHKLREILQR